MSNVSALTARLTQLKTMGPGDFTAFSGNFSKLSDGFSELNCAVPDFTAAPRYYKELGDPGECALQWDVRRFEKALARRDQLIASLALAKPTPTANKKLLNSFVRQKVNIRDMNGDFGASKLLKLPEEQRAAVAQQQLQVATAALSGATNLLANMLTNPTNVPSEHLTIVRELKTQLEVFVAKATPVPGNSSATTTTSTSTTTTTGASSTATPQRRRAVGSTLSRSSQPVPRNATTNQASPRTQPTKDPKAQLEELKVQKQYAQARVVVAAYERDPSTVDVKQYNVALAMLDQKRIDDQIAALTQQMAASATPTTTATTAQAPTTTTTTTTTTLGPRLSTTTAKVPTTAGPTTTATTGANAGVTTNTTRTTTPASVVALGKESDSNEDARVVSLDSSSDVATEDSDDAIQYVPVGRSEKTPNQANNAQ